MHNWGDDSKNIDWKGIGEAANYLGENLTRWGRMSAHTKEKFGTVRCYVTFGWHQLFSITHPGYCYSRYPNWLWHLDCQYISRIMWLVNWFVVPYQKLLYTYFYGRALKKWPHLRSELLQGADCNELLRKYGVHSVRTSQNSYSIHYDWHPDNYYVKYPSKDSEGEE